MYVCLLCIHVCLSLSVHLSLYVCLSVSRDFIGKEIVSRFGTDLQTDKTWYTDANGKEMQKRV